MRARNVSQFSRGDHADPETELRMLRESTRSALEESWAQVEQLQQENAEYTEENSSLKIKVETLERREKAYLRQLEEMRKQLDEATPRQLQHEVYPIYDEPSTSSSSNRTNEGFVSKMKRVTSFQAFRPLAEQDDSKSLDSAPPDLEHEDWDQFIIPDATSTSISCASVLTEDEFSGDTKERKPGMKSFFSNASYLLASKKDREEKERLQAEYEALRHMEQERKGEIAELLVKAEGRDSAIESMEKLAQMMGETVDLLRHQLDETKTRASEKEESLKKQISVLKKKNHDKKKKIASQSKKIAEYRDRIGPLTDKGEKKVYFKDQVGGRKPVQQV